MILLPFPFFSTSTQLILVLVVVEYTRAVYPEKQQITDVLKLENIIPVNQDDLFTSEDEGRNIVITNEAMGARCAVAADFDGDGLMDLVTASSNDNAVSWFRNLGGQPPNFSIKKQITWSSLGSRIVAVADIDGDGDIDVVGASYYDSALRWFENDGNGIFTSHVISFGVNEGQGVTVSDLDNDGSPDIIIASSGDNTIAVFKNMGGGDFCEIKEVVDDNAIGARTVVASDLNGDGWIDLASASKDDNTVAWYPNDGTGHFSTKHIISSGEESKGAYSLVSVDIDNDGDNDLVVASNGNDHVSIWRNEGSGNFTKTLVYDQADFVLSVTAVDFDRDGDIDIASASFFDGHINWYENVDGEGRIWKNHTIYVGIQGHYVSHADMDGDGDDDLIGVTHAENKVAVFLAKTGCDGLKQQECCYPGTEWNGTYCEPCPRGTYGNNSGVYAQCVECPSDACIIPGLSVMPPTCSGITGCTDKQISVAMCSCPADTVKDPSSDTCQTCPEGQIRPDIGVVRGSDTIGNYTAWELEQGTCYVGKPNSSQIDSLDCSPGGELKIITTELLSEQAIKFDIVNTNGDLVHHYEKEITTCVSPTDCFILNFDPSTIFPVKISISVDGIQILNEFGHEANSSFDFGYSSLDNFIKVGSCDSVEFCNSTVIDKQDPKRQIFNSFTKLFGIDMLDEKESHRYNAFCMFLSLVGKIYSNLTSTEETFVLAYPLYILTLFYKSTKGENWYNNESWLKSFDFCSWYGVYCDSYGLVSIMNLTSNNLEGSLPTEMGKLLGIEQLILDDNSLTGPIPIEMMKLFSIKQLRLSNNKIIGIIPSEINLLENLVELDLSTNLLSDSLPVEIGGVSKLEILDLSGNIISGTFPNFESMTKLKKLSLSRNLFEGKVHDLSKLVYLEHLDLSHNYFNGGLPFSGSQDKLRHINLSGNTFIGRIPPTIKGMKSLEILYLFDNKITGTIPNEIGSLTYLSNISISYNNLKGTIPPDIQKIENLKLLHLQSNTLQGIADFSVPEFITDCGMTSGTQPLIICDTCTYCCNENDVCLEMSSRWPRKGLRDFLHKLELRSKEDHFIDATTLTLLIISFFFVVFFFIGLFLRSLRFVTKHEQKCKIKLPFVVEKTFQAESVYSFFLTSNSLAWFFALFATMCEIMFLCIFMQYSDTDSGENELAYEHICLPNSLECNKISSISKFGQFAFILVVVIFLLPDFIDGFLLFYESVTVGNKRGIFASTIVLYVTCFSFVVQILYNNAIGIRNVDLLHNAVVVLYLNDLDEKIFDALKRFNPNWVEKLEAEIATRSEKHENIDDDDDLIDQFEFKRELNNVKADIRHIRSVSCLDDFDERLIDSMKRLNPNWVENRDTEKATNSEKPKYKDDNENYESITQKSEMLKFKRELNNIKVEIRNIRSVPEANLDVGVPSTEVMELKREIHNLKTELRNIHHVLRQNLYIEGSMFDNDRIETMKSPRFTFRQNLNLGVGSTLDNNMIETGRSSGSSSSSMVGAELLTPKGTRRSVCKDAVEG